MKKRDYLLCFLLATIALVSRAPLIEKFQSQWDGPQYSIAVVRYSYEQFTPTPPGYPLYIALAKFFYIFLHDPHKAILTVSVFGSVFGAIAFYLVGKNMYHRSVGLISSVIFLTGSTFYYFGLTTYAYGLIAGVDVLLVYSVYRILIQHKREGLFFGTILGICFGIRPQELLQIAPIVFLGLLLLPNREKIKAILIYSFITLFWLVPIVYSTGIYKFVVLWYNSLQNGLIDNSFKTRVELMVKGFLLSFSISAGFLLYYVWVISKKKNIWGKNKKIIFFYTIWVVPGFLYNLFLGSQHAGYQMSYLTGFLILISYAVWQTTKKYKMLFVFTVCAIALFNLYWFFFDRDPHFVKPYRPTSFHYSDIRKNDVKVGSKVQFVQERFDPQKTLLISTEVLWRPYSYYLKTYHLIALTALDNIESPYIYNRFETTNWNLRWYQTKNFTVIIPKNILAVIFMDDPASQWIRNYRFIQYNLPGNSSITKISVKPGDTIVYGYHSIKVINHYE